MAERKIQTFFYGSYMNLVVLKEVRIIPERWEIAKLNGYGIRIEPRANLVAAERHCVYGVIATATHEELARLYAHAQNVLGEIYLPEAVLVETLDGKWLPALCYICHDMKPRPAANDYIDRIVKPARELGFPQWYIERLESFRSAL